MEARTMCPLCGMLGPAVAVTGTACDAIADAATEAEIDGWLTSSKHSGPWVPAHCPDCFERERGRP